MSTDWRIYNAEWIPELATETSGSKCRLNTSKHMQGVNLYVPFF